MAATATTKPYVPRVSAYAALHPRITTQGQPSKPIVATSGVAQGERSSILPEAAATDWVIVLSARVPGEMPVMALASASGLGRRDAVSPLRGEWRPSRR